MEKEGLSRVEIVGVDNKQQITAVFATSLAGDFLPPQRIYKGNTVRCLPTISFPHDSHITHSENHWSNERTMIAYIERILLPYITKIREELKLQSDYPALVIFDKFTGQGTEKVLKSTQEQQHSHRHGSRKLHRQVATTGHQCQQANKELSEAAIPPVVRRSRMPASST